MSDTTTGAAAPATEDERLAFRSVFQRIFIRPESGALIGAVAIWVFFWAVSANLGTVGGTQNWLDSASTLGIMAVAVSVLMIGGEFDLSSGANTGAMGILFILLVKETGDLGGLGLTLWIAVPLSFAVAMAIGFFNGWMVERTALPSFIVTLGTFFVLKGAKLGFAKLIVDQISVSFTDQVNGYWFFRPIFAAEWARRDHVFNGRDPVYNILLIGGGALLLLAVAELFFRRRALMRSAGIAIFALGGAVAIGGLVLLHTTDGTAANLTGGLVIAAGTVVGLYGFCHWRYEPVSTRGSLSMGAAIGRLAGLGLLSALVAIVLAFVIDGSSKADIVFPFTTQGLRATLVGIFAGGGLVLLAMAAHRAMSVNVTTKAAVSVATAGVLVAFALTVRATSEVEKLRTEAFGAVMLAAMVVFAWAVVSWSFEERRSVDRVADRAGTRAALVAASLIALGLILRPLFTTDAELEAGIPPAKFSIRMVWFFGFTAVLAWVLARTRFGSWTFAVGGNKEAARQVGVPAARTKTQLFMLVAGAAWLVGMMLAFRLNSLQAGAGDGLEFEFIIAAVVGGTLLTGGYGSAIGGAIGACIMAMSEVGIPNSRWNSDWRFAFLGGILLLAVIANRYIRTKAEAVRR